MENKINIAEILKKCPKGMELDCTMFEDVYFDCVDELNIIHCYIQHETYKTSLTFNQYGAFNSDIKSKCVIFPKGKTTWEGFIPPGKFKDGDVIVEKWGSICIYKNNAKFKGIVDYYCGILSSGDFKTKDEKYPLKHFGGIEYYRLATEEEKQKLFDAIKDNGYKWNADTKTLEKLEQPKFDITTLKPFESKVLIRGGEECFWKPAIFGFCTKINFYVLGGNAWEQCIPFKNNEHLLGTTDDCDEFYKTW